MDMSNDNTVTYTLRIRKDVIDKIKYIAERSVRSANQEILYAALLHIERYEEEHGKITSEELSEVEIIKKTKTIKRYK